MELMGRYIPNERMMGGWVGGWVGGWMCKQMDRWCTADTGKIVSRREVEESSLVLVDARSVFNTSVLFRPVRESGLNIAARTTYLSVPVKRVRCY
jgi:hypothetical protein